MLLSGAQSLFDYLAHLAPSLIWTGLRMEWREIHFKVDAFLFIRMSYPTFPIPLKHAKIAKCILVYLALMATEFVVASL